MADFDVTKDRDKWIGGSDIPCIMGLSTFQTRWELLQEKAGLKESDFLGNKYTEYGKKMEGIIRDYINGKRYKIKFEPFRRIVGDFRAHTDGFDGEAVLEIKTTSHIYETVDEYKVYLVQLLKYMEVNEVKKGILAVYSRPDDFSLEFNPDRLQTFSINISDYTNLLQEINYELDRFREDLEKLKENPLLSEQDFQPNELVALSKAVMVFEDKLAQMKLIEAESKKAKQALYEAMAKHGVKSWSTPNGTKITMVDAIPASVETVTEFDEVTFRTENEGLYNMYLHDVKKKKSGKSGYVKITLPKG